MQQQLTETEMENLTKVHLMGGHTGLKSVFVVSFTQTKDADVVFLKESDADEYLKVRKHQGLWEFTKTELPLVENGIIGIGPYIGNKVDGCPLCEKKLKEENNVKSKLGCV